MVIGLIARDPNAITPRSSSHIVTINADMNLIVDNAKKASILGCCLVYVMDITMSRVRSLQLLSVRERVSEKWDKFTVQKVKKLKKALEV